MTNLGCQTRGIAAANQRLLAVVALVLAGAQLAVADEPVLRIISDADTATITAGERPVVRYRYAGAPFKPYVQELYTPAGVNVLLDSPPDHLHHHGLMYAVMVNGVNFWEETEPAGRQEGLGLGIRYEPADARPSAAHTARPTVPTLTQRLDWKTPDSGALLTEMRVIRVCPELGQQTGATIVVWSSALMPGRGAEITLTGNHYHGLGLRFVRALDRTGTFDNAEHDPGQIFRGEERLAHGRWCSYTGEIDGRPVTVAMFDYPGNPRPATWFTMKEPFAYLSATLNLHREPLVLREPAKLSYAVALWDGRVAAERIEQAYQRWAEWGGAATQPAEKPDK
jgi:hypothetical protein